MLHSKKHFDQANMFLARYYTFEKGWIPFTSVMMLVHAIAQTKNFP